MPDTTRIKAAALAALVAVTCAACGSTTTVSASPISPVSVDCGLPHFNIPLATDGYLYADGPTVLVAYVDAGAPPATVEDAVTRILDNLG